MRSVRRVCGAGHFLGWADSATGAGAGAEQFRSWKRRGRSGELEAGGVKFFSKELIPKGGTVVPKNSGPWEQHGGKKGGEPGAAGF